MNKFYILLLLLVLFISNEYLKIKQMKNSNEINNLLQNLKDKKNFYKNLLQLYIENREEFYIKGRQYWMSLHHKKYNDSNIITIQDKLNYLLTHNHQKIKLKLLIKYYYEIILKKYWEKIYVLLY